MMPEEQNKDSSDQGSKQPGGPRVALTKEEFEQRFSERLEIFSIAMSLDTGDVFSKPLPRGDAKRESEILNRVAELVNREVSRIVDLVYDETL